jgi:uncharacterized protein DUF1579
MRIATVAWAAGALVVLGYGAGRVLSQDSGEEPKKEPAKDTFQGADPRETPPAEMQKRMREAMTPNRFHKKLERFLGDWDVEMRMWMSQDGKPMVSKGTATCTWLYEGKWIQTDVEVPLMGMKVRARTTLGYDNFKKKYVCSKVSSLETALRTFEGNFGKDESTLFLYGFVDEYMTGEHDKVAADVFRFDGPDRFVLEIHDLAIGLEHAKVLEYVYTRRK